MRPLPVGAAVLLLAVGFAGCAGPNETAPNRDVRAGWERDRAAHGPVGLPASLDLGGAPLHLSGTGSVPTVAAPFRFLPAPLAFEPKTYLFFPNATVNGGASGLLALEGSVVQAEAGSLEGVPFGRLFVNASARLFPEQRPMAGGIPPDLPPDWSDGLRSLRASWSVAGRVVEVRVTGFQRAVHVTNAGNQSLSGPLTVRAEGFAWVSGSSLEVNGTVNAKLDRFALGGNVTQGVLKPQGRADVTAPKGVFGRDAHLQAEPARLRSIESFRLTQALTEGGLLLPAGVELVPEAPDLAVAPGKERWVSVSYRETSYVADAVMKNVTVTGAGASLVQVPVGPPPLFIESLWMFAFELIDRAPWPGLFVAIPIAVASPWVLFVDATVAIVCAFTTCPEKHPYPIWMDAGDVGVFYYKVKGVQGPGTYEATITITGQNHPPVTLPVRITVA